MPIYRSRGFAIFMLIAGIALLTVGLIDFVLNFGEFLLVASLAPIALGLVGIGSGIASLRAQRKRGRSTTRESLPRSTTDT